MRVSFNARNAAFSTLNWVLLTMVVIPLAKNIPASVTIKGWISRYAIRKPCTNPNAVPMPSAIKIAVVTLPPW